MALAAELEKGEKLSAAGDLFCSPVAVAGVVVLFAVKSNNLGVPNDGVEIELGGGACCVCGCERPNVKSGLLAICVVEEEVGNVDVD